MAKREDYSAIKWIVYGIITPTRWKVGRGLNRIELVLKRCTQAGREKRPEALSHAPLKVSLIYAN